MSPLLEIKDFSLSFPAPDGQGRPQQVLCGVDLSIEEGATHGLVGESGSGKSITALSILRLLDGISTTSCSGSIRFAGLDMLRMDESSLRAIRGNRIAMIFQEPMTSLNPLYTIGNQLMEPLMLHQKLDRARAGKMAVELLDRTGITEPDKRINSYPHQLSGGQRQRVIIAMALACQPQLLIADEPTTALDVTVQAQILELIRDIQREFGMAMLLITHDLPMVREMADTVSIMHQGQIVERNTTEALFKVPRHEYTRRLLASLPHGKPVACSGSRPLFEMRHIGCIFPLGKKGLFSRSTVHLQALDQVSATVRQSATLGIVGESGSGKSTLALCLLRLLRCSGNILYHRDKETVDLAVLTNGQMRPLRKDLQIVFQDPYSSLSPRMPVGEIVGEGLSVHRIGANRSERRAMVRQALQDVELDPSSAERYPHEFSGGQRQRIAIARALVLRPQLLILDEPTSALDMTIQAQVIDLLKRLQERFHLTYIFITHDLRVIRSIAHDLLVMQQGRVVESGPAADIFSNPRQEYTRQLFHAAFGRQEETSQ